MSDPVTNIKQNPFASEGIPIYERILKNKEDMQMNSNSFNKFQSLYLFLFFFSMQQNI